MRETYPTAKGGGDVIERSDKKLQRKLKQYEDERAGDRQRGLRESAARLPFS